MADYEIDDWYEGCDKPIVIRAWERNIFNSPFDKIEFSTLLEQAKEYIGRLSLEEWWETHGRWFMDTVYPWSDGMSILASSALKLQSWYGEAVERFSFFDNPNCGLMMVIIHALTNMVQEGKLENFGYSLTPSRPENERTLTARWAETKRIVDDFYGRGAKSSISQEIEMDEDKQPLPEPQAPCARMGWISPNGEFYPCAYTSHKDLAYLLCEKHYNNSAGQYFLEEKGWLSIQAEAHIRFPWNQDGTMRIVYTQAQRDTIRAIVEAFEKDEADNPDIDWDITLQNNPEDYHMVDFWTYPADHIPDGMTFAQALREEYDSIFEGEKYPEREETKHFIDPALRYQYAEHPGD